jgi:hypothetical protein
MKSNQGGRAIIRAEAEMVVVEVVRLAIMNIVTAVEMIIVIEEGEMVVEEQGYNVSSAEVLIMHQRVPISVTSDEYQR